MEDTKTVSVRRVATEPVHDMGIKVAFDHITVWSKDREGLQRLSDALQKMGCETTGVF